MHCKFAKTFLQLNNYKNAESFTQELCIAANAHSFRFPFFLLFGAHVAGVKGKEQVTSGIFQAF